MAFSPKTRALLSIKPEFVNRILDGTKRFEYRRTIFREPVESVVIYSTKPVGQVVAEFDIERIHRLPVAELWNATKDYAGISHDRFMEYFSGRDIGYAIEIGAVNRFDQPLCIDKDFGVTPPQSYVYVF